MLEKGRHVCAIIAALIPSAQEAVQLGTSPTLAEAHLATVGGAVRSERYLVDHVVEGDLHPGGDCDRVPQSAGLRCRTHPLWTQEPPVCFWKSSWIHVCDPSLHFHFVDRITWLCQVYSRAVMIYATRKPDFEPIPDPSPTQSKKHHSLLYAYGGSYKYTNIQNIIQSHCTSGIPGASAHWPLSIHPSRCSGIQTS